MYPEDLNLKESATAFFKEKQQYDPNLFVETEDPEADTIKQAPDEIDPKVSDYGKMPQAPILSVADSDKFSGKM